MFDLGKVASPKIVQGSYLIIIIGYHGAHRALRCSRPPPSTRRHVANGPFGGDAPLAAIIFWHQRST